MTKLDIDTYKIKNQILPPLEESIDALNGAIKRLSNVSIPYDFRYKNKIYGISSDAQHVRDELNETFKILDTTAKKINYNEEQMEKLLYSLSRNQIIVRNLN